MQKMLLMGVNKNLRFLMEGLYHFGGEAKSVSVTLH